MTIFWGLLFLVLSLFGLFIMATTPLAKKYKSSQYIDIGSGAFLIFISIVYFMVAHVLPSEDDSTEPCSRNSPQAICYGLDSDVCNEAWKSFDESCDEEVKPIREKRPSALLYPIIYKCHAQKFDKITFYNRRKTDSPFCQQYFKKIEN